MLKLKYETEYEGDTNNEDINHSELKYTYHIGIDEAGRGPLLGRVYAAAVVLPEYCENSNFHFEWMKDSKKFSSKKKLDNVAEHIRTHAIAWSVCHEDENVIDNINILQATYSAMHKAIRSVLAQLNDSGISQQNESLLMIDGRYFNSYTAFENGDIVTYPHVCVEKGDGKFANIAAASILAKSHRDNYISELCLQYPSLDTYYNISSNKGYGAKAHRDGIKEHGITQFHRKSYKICNEAPLTHIPSVTSNTEVYEHSDEHTTQS